MPKIDHNEARTTLSKAFVRAESEFLDPKASGEFEILRPDLQTVFGSTTKAYREVLLGCVLAKLTDPSTDIRMPYVKLPGASFSGRSLDQKVLNPFLDSRRIPCTRNPYLSVFRRQVSLTLATREGLDDKSGYDALLNLIQHVEDTQPSTREAFLIELLSWFIRLREHATVPIAKLNRVSLTQHRDLIDGLLPIASGGRIPVMLLTAMFSALREHFGLAWEIEFQGINEADSAARAGGDITIREHGKILLVAEVTERVVDKSRVVSTFNTKISPGAIEDYVFFINDSVAHEPAIAQAAQYFAQGSEVNFVDIRGWLGMSLVTLGKGGRAQFNEQLRTLLDSDDTPRAVKVAWNDLVSSLTSV